MSNGITISPAAEIAISAQEPSQLPKPENLDADRRSQAKRPEVSPIKSLNEFVRIVKSQIVGEMELVKKLVPEANAHISEILQVAGYPTQGKGNWTSPKPPADPEEMARLQSNLQSILGLKAAIYKEGSKYCVEALDGTAIGKSPNSRKFAKYAYDCALSKGLNPGIALALINKESSYRPRIVSDGNYGLCQVRQGTFSSVATKADRQAGILNPHANIRAGMTYLAQQKETFGNTREALAAYNAGPGRVEQYNGVPPFSVTRHYVAKIPQWGNEYMKSLAETMKSNGTDVIQTITQKYPLLAKKEMDIPQPFVKL